MKKKLIYIFQILVNISLVFLLTGVVERIHAAGPVFIDTNVNGILDVGELSFPTILEAVNAATAGETIKIPSGTYDTSGQILIDEDLNIVGDASDKPIIRPTGNLTGNNATSAWFLVASGTTFNISDVVLDGSTFFVWQGLRSHGDTTINNVDFRNIQGSLSGSPYRGIAVLSFGGTIPGGGGSDTHGSGGAPSTLVVTDSTFEQIGRVGVLVKGTESTASITDNTYTGKGDGNFLDYAFEAGAGGSISASGNTISDNRGVATSDGSTSAGILVTDFFGTGTNASIDGNTFLDNSTGLFVGFDSTDESVVTAHENDFSGQIIAIESTAPAVDADSNWWGTVDLAEINAKISGALVTFDPWYIDSSQTILSNAAILHVIKLVVNDGDGTAVASDFNVHVIDVDEDDVVGSPEVGTITPGTLYSLPAGTYVISENVDPAYIQTFTGDCDSSGTVVLALGEEKICTVINTNIPPPVLVSSGGSRRRSRPSVPDFPNTGLTNIAPLIGILKVPTPLTLQGGSGEVTYDYTVWNAGVLRALTDITVNDDKCSPIVLRSGDSNKDGKLNLGENWKYSCTMTLSNTTTNTTIATGYSDDSNYEAAIATAVATVVVGIPVPSFPNTGSIPPLINILKIPSRLTPFPPGGGNVTYTYTVTNPGVVPMHDVNVVDDQCSLVSLSSGDVNNNNLLEPAETWVYTCSEHISVSTRNVATAIGKANGFITLGYAFATVLVSLPDFPNTGFLEEALINLGKGKISKSDAVIIFHRLLSMGIQGEDVVALQTALVQKGFLEIPSGVAYGFFGGLTHAAIIKYQASAGLLSDGILGPLTTAKLISDLEE